jgi:hypothetical protein
MQRWQGAALVAALCSGCLDSLVDDQPGYSRHLLPAGSDVPSAYDDPTTARKIDNNDGLTGQTIPLRDGFVAGSAMKYWDLGVGKRTASPAYVLTRCQGGIPMREPRVDHPMLIDTIPGDNDYSPFRTIGYVCISDKYQGERITSVEALYDAIDMKLVQEPLNAITWFNAPVVNRDISLSLGANSRLPSNGYYKGNLLQYHQFLDQEGEFPNTGTLPTPGYAYDIAKPGATGVAKVIFSQPFRMPDGSKNPAYSPQWLQVTVALKSTLPPEQIDAELASWDSDDDIVMYTGPMNTPVAKTGTAVASVTITANRLNRTFMVNEVAP